MFIYCKCRYDESVDLYAESANMIEAQCIKM